MLENGEPVLDVALDLPQESTAATFGIVLLIDASMSMKGEPIKQAMAAARAFTLEVNEGTLVSVVLFNNKVTTLVPFTADLGAVANAVATTAKACLRHPDPRRRGRRRGRARKRRHLIRLDRPALRRQRRRLERHAEGDARPRRQRRAAHLHRRPRFGSVRARDAPVAREDDRRLIRRRHARQGSHRHLPCDRRHHLECVRAQLRVVRAAGGDRQRGGQGAGLRGGRIGDVRRACASGRRRVGPELVGSVHPVERGRADRQRSHHRAHRARDLPPRPSPRPKRRATPVAVRHPAPRGAGPDSPPGHPGDAGRASGPHPRPQVVPPARGLQAARERRRDRTRPRLGRDDRAGKRARERRLRFHRGGAARGVGSVRRPHPSPRRPLVRLLEAPQAALGLR